jgi:hypothetical protein
MFPETKKLENVRPNIQKSQAQVVRLEAVVRWLIYLFVINYVGKF